jgi:outer membrane protein assembly factor BamB
VNRIAAVGLLVAIFFLANPAEAGNWPQWRGPANNGISPETNLPAAWAESQNIAWTLKLPGMGGSTPIVWGARLFLTSEEGNDVVLLCVGTDGQAKWKQQLGTGRRRFMRDEGNQASASPCTDGRHVYAFAGTGDFACFDLDGKEVWRFNAQDRYGRFQIMHGMHVTPLLDGDRLYLSLLHAGAMWVLALDKATGNEIWKVERPTDGVFEGRQSYASPCLWRNGQDAYLVVHGCDYTTAHRLKDGQELWRLSDLNPKGRYNKTLRFVASPATAPDLIVVPTAKNGPVVGVRPDVRGAITAGGPGELWRRPKNTPDVPSPLIHDGLVYLCGERGLLLCLDAKTGKELYSQQLHRARYRASPVLADGKLYLTARDGTVTVAKVGPKFDLLATNRLPDELTASPVVADGRIYLRGFGALYAISQGGK